MQYNEFVHVVLTDFNPQFYYKIKTIIQILQQ